MANSSILSAFERMWQHVVVALNNKSDINHSHNDIYYTELEIDNKVSTLNTTLNNKQDAITGTSGQFVVIGTDGKPTTKTISYAEGVSF